jgi:hypothetical protein
MRAIAIAFVATCLLMAGDDPAKKVQEKPATFEPRSVPGAGQKLLEKFVGEWDVTKVFHPRSGEPIRATGQCRQTMIHDGRFLQSDFVFGEGDKKTTGMGIIGFEPESGTFTSFWTDSRQTRMSIRQSREPFDGQTIVLYSRTLDPEGKEPWRSKTVSRLEDNGKKLHHQQFALGSGGEERLMMELIMTRKARATTPAR